VERLSDPAHHRDADRQQDKTAAEAERADEPADREASQEHASTAFQLPEERSLDSEAQPNRSEGDGALVTGASDALAGGIGKLAEILADVIAGLICPESERDRARRRAATKAQQERAPPQPPAPPPGLRTSFSFDTFFGEHGERLRREDEERRQKRNERLRE
jgi:hypothetical protein